MSRLKYFFLFVITVIAFSCKPGIPSQYVQPDELESLLYDLHIADAMAEENQDGGNIVYEKMLYRQAVLKKYGITQADFDSTLVYYTRHSDKLYAIYDKLAKRFGDEAIALGASANDVNQYGNITAEGDTANVWTGEKSVVLTADAPYNVMNFDITADSTYHKGDRMILSFNSNFIFQDGMRDAIAMLSVTFSNDSIASSVMHISANSRYNVTVSDNDRLGIKSIRGFFFLPKSADGNVTSLRVLSLNGITLVRAHDNEKPANAVSDSTKLKEADTLSRRNIPRPDAPVMNNGQTGSQNPGTPPPPSMPARRPSEPIQLKSGK